MSHIIAGLIQIVLVLLGVGAVVMLYRRIRGLAPQQRVRVLMLNLILVFLFWAILRLPLHICAVFLLLVNVAVVGFMGKQEETRAKLLGDQLINALLIISGALKAGRTLEQGFELVSRSMPDPISHEFRACLAEMELGIPFEQSLRNLLERIPTHDFKLFVTATLFQRETGGNLIALYDQIIFAVSERKKVLGRLEAQTMQQRYSAYVVMALPIGLYIILSWLNPGHIAVLHDTQIGQLAFYSAIFLQILGVVILRTILTRTTAG
ncbi:MAG: type II secretion system F family protein [Candidatus Wallbacteria bacterium]|nr:type II secretion system F family protein [Candidatus Wallbacteria bacterium]